MISEMTRGVRLLEGPNGSPLLPLSVRIRHKMKKTGHAANVFCGYTNHFFRAILKKSQNQSSKFQFETVCQFLLG